MLTTEEQKEETTMTQLEREHAIRTKNLMEARRRLAQETGIPKNEIRIIETGRSARTTDYRLEYEGQIAGWVEEKNIGGAWLLVNED